MATTSRFVVFAADISPVDVISHLPIQCEEQGVPYCFVRSRMELGTRVILRDSRRGGPNEEADVGGAGAAPDER